MVIQERTASVEYRFFCRNFQDMITVDACLSRRKNACQTGSSACTGCSKDTLITRTSRGGLKRRLPQA